MHGITHENAALLICQRQSEGKDGGWPDDYTVRFGHVIVATDAYGGGPRLDIEPLEDFLRDNLDYLEPEEIDRIDPPIEEDDENDGDEGVLE